MEEKDAKRLIQKAYRLAYDYEMNYGTCGQAVIAALQDTFDMRNDDIFKAAGNLAGGVGALPDVGCSAYVGGALFLGQLTGRERKNYHDPEMTRAKGWVFPRKLHDKIIAEFGTAICRDIVAKMLGRWYYPPDPDEFAKLHDPSHAKVFPTNVGKIASWVAEIVIQEKLIPEDKLKALVEVK